MLDQHARQYNAGIRAQVIQSVNAIKSWRKIDDATIELETNGVDTTMPPMLNRFLIASPAQFEKVGRDWTAFRHAASGTGPWKLASFVPRERAQLVRNADGWQTH